MKPHEELYDLEGLVREAIRKCPPGKYAVGHQELLKVLSSIRNVARAKSDKNITFRADNSAGMRDAFSNGFALGQEIKGDVTYFHSEGTSICSLFWDESSHERLKKALVKVRRELDSAMGLIVAAEVHNS